MADETTSTWADLLREAKGPLVEALKFKTVLLSEVKRDKSPRRWHGKQVTIPIWLAPQQGTGGITEQGTLNTTIPVETEQAVVNSGIIGVPISFSTQVLRQAAGDENSWAEILPTKMERAEDGFGRVINEMMTGSGDALLADVSAATGASGGANQNIALITGTNLANLYQLYVGRVVDVRVRSTGSLVAGATMPVKIRDINLTTGIINVVNIDGSATSFATATTDGIYIQGSNRNVAGVNTSDAIQGLLQAAATTGTFETINKANVDAWRGTDASPAALTDPSIAVFDKAERLGMQRAGKVPAFYLTDPAVVDKYTQGLTVQARWAGEEGELASGWTGVRYRNKLLIPDFDMAPQTAIGVPLSDMNIYTLDDGPDWDDHTGSVFQRFGTRSLPLEAWLIWMLQLGFQACNSIVRVGNLSQAA